nr:ATP synthase F0 subunit 8 [Nisia atrovenosa]WOW98921.1 ATP synthase F0 subunit 8 [Nisia atrovenosa]
MPQMSNLPWMTLFLLTYIITLMIECNLHFSKKKKW